MKRIHAIFLSLFFIAANAPGVLASETAKNSNPKLPITPPPATSNSGQLHRSISSILSNILSILNSNTRLTNLTRHKHQSAPISSPETMPQTIGSPSFCPLYRPIPNFPKLDHQPTSLTTTPNFSLLKSPNIGFSDVSVERSSLYLFDGYGTDTPFDANSLKNT